MYSNTELSEKISKCRIAVNDLALVVEMNKKNTDFKEEFSVNLSIIIDILALVIDINKRTFSGSIVRF
jgi:hypothetical protein